MRVHLYVTKEGIEEYKLGNPIHGMSVKQSPEFIHVDVAASEVNVNAGNLYHTCLITPTCTNVASPGEQKEWEIWSEGYLVTGMEGIPAKAHLHGKETGRTFKEACIKFFAKDKKEGHYFQPTSMTYWGCSLFANEADARKSFG